MGNIKAFLQPPVMGQTKEVIISKRFKDEEGKLVPFVIRVIDQETNDKLIRRATKKTKANGQIIQELDNERYIKLLLDACVVEPDFKDADVCAFYKAVDPLDVPGRMLTVGEYNRLAKEIREFNDLTVTDEDISAIEETAKN